MSMHTNPEREGLNARISRMLARVGGTVLLLCALAISTDVLTRSLVGRTFLESFELSRYGFAVAVALGMAHALVTAAHIRIDVVYRLMPARARLLLDVLALASMAALAFLLAFQGIDLAHDSWSRHARSATSLSVPLSIPQFLWAAGLAWFAISCLWLTLRSLPVVLGRRPRHGGAGTERPSHTPQGDTRPTQ